MSSIAKISVEKPDSKEQILYDFDKSKNLDENIKKICRQMGLPESLVFGLKHNPTKDLLLNHYISEANMENIKHNDCLKLVFSISFKLDRLEKHLSSPGMRQVIFEDIHSLSTDPVFIDELVDRPALKILIDLFTSDTLQPQELHALLVTIHHLFAKGYFLLVSKDVLVTILKFVKQQGESTDVYKYCLFTLQKILSCKLTEFNSWKEEILKSLPLQIVVSFIRMSNSDLQYSALWLINTMIKSCKGEKRQRLIKEMNQSKNREDIYNNIILKGDLEKKMQHELYVLQTYLLSLFTPAYTSNILVNDNALFKRDDFELCSEDLRRITILMDFDEDNTPFPQYSLESLILNDSDRTSNRISLASMKSEDSLKTESKRSSTRLESVCYDNETLSISHLTLEALRHYKSMHYRNFHQSQIEEKLYEPGIFVTSEKVVKILANLLHIGFETPDNRSTFYQPVVFFCSRRTPFFLELFSRTMWLLSQTRREMKALTIADYPKVMYILEKQIKTALETRPKDFKSLTATMSETSFKVIMEQIHKKKEEELQHLIDYHPCLQEMKAKFTILNKEQVAEQRMGVLFSGSHFPQVMEKKTSGNILVKLSKNYQHLLVYQVKNVTKPEDIEGPELHVISDITHVVTGKNCDHSHLCDPKLAFTVIINNDKKIKFIAKNEKLAAYWTDALILLTKKDEQLLSKYYTDELNELVSMDIRLALLEVQNIKLPKHPPPVPPLPKVLKPPLPPKPMLRKHSKIF